MYVCMYVMESRVILSSSLYAAGNLTCTRGLDLNLNLLTYADDMTSMRYVCRYGSKTLSI